MRGEQRRGRGQIVFDQRAGAGGALLPRRTGDVRRRRRRNGRIPVRGQRLAGARDQMDPQREAHRRGAAQQPAQGLPQQDRHRRSQEGRHGQLRLQRHQQHRLRLPRRLPQRSRNEIIAIISTNSIR